MIRERGPMTVAAFMDLALYDPEFGYYARAAQRSGRAGDFFTSVDVGPLFGELLEIQLAEMADISPVASAIPNRHQFSPLRSRRSRRRQRPPVRRHPARGATPRSRLLRSHPPASRRSQRGGARRAARDARRRRPIAWSSSSDALPDSFEGVLVANELLDAMPVHQVVMRDDGLREICRRRRRSRGLRGCLTR